MNDNHNIKQSEIPLKTIVLAFGESIFVIDVPTLIGNLNHTIDPIYMKINEEISVKVEIPAVLAFIFSGKCQIRRIFDIILVDIRQFAAHQIKISSHTFFWVYAVKKLGWTDVDVFDFGSDIEMLFSGVPDLHMMLDECLNEWTNHQTETFFSYAVDFFNNLRRMFNHIFYFCWSSN